MSMEYVHAAILLHKAGKQITEDSLTQVLTAAGITTDPIRVKALIASLAEVNIDEALKQATTFAPVVAPAAAAPAQGAEAKPAAAAEDKKKKEEEEKKKEEQAIEGLGALFG
jgi:large subunit ribosomal protein L12